jgi:hypothetical protein
MTAALIALAVIVALFVITTVVLRNAQVRFRSRQWEAVQRLSPGAVVFGIYESPVVLTQLNHLRATTVPPLPPLERERRPLAVSVSAGEIAVWRGNSPPGRVVSLPTSILRSVRLNGGDSSAAQATVQLDIDWQNQIVGFTAMLFEGHVGGSPTHRARMAELRGELQRFVSIAP